MSRPARAKAAELPAWLRAALGVSELPDDASPWERYKRDFPPADRLREAWRDCGPGVLARWVQLRPGTRPSAWWRFDAPRAPRPAGFGAWAEQVFPLPRRRLGGRGELQPWARIECGLPRDWPAAGFDPLDPPTFEAEAAYLARLGLLMAGERERLADPDLAPVPLPRCWWPATT